jgi:hypothetical protein
MHAAELGVYFLFVVVWLVETKPLWFYSSVGLNLMKILFHFDVCTEILCEVKTGEHSPRH